MVVFCFIYETRHIILWLLLYYLFYHFHSREAFKRFRLKHILFFISALTLVWTLFVFMGNVRSGITTTDSQLFALAMAIDQRWSNMPMPIIWALIYLFGGIARGVVNEGLLVPFNAVLSPVIFPGFLQRFFSGNLGEVKLVTQFADQHFIIDGWHNFALHFGWSGGLIIVLFQIGLLIILGKSLQLGHKTGYNIGPKLFAIYLWITIRIFLLPIGNYLLGFGALMELLFLGFFLIIGEVKFQPVGAYKE